LVEHRASCAIREFSSNRTDRALVGGALAPVLMLVAASLGVFAALALTRNLAAMRGINLGVAGTVAAEVGPKLFVTARRT
jgi:hypothetical protein